MLYRYDEKSLNYIRVRFGEVIFKTVLITVTLITIYGLSYKIDRAKVDSLTEEEKLIIIDDYNEFSEEKLIEEIKSRNLRFPYIVLAQAKLESNHFKSKIFLYNNNMFGMKEAKGRPTTAEGTQYGHAFYPSWTRSVEDYALYSGTYLNKLRTESKYYNYLSQNYAEDPMYVSKLKDIIEREDLKDKF